MSAKLIVGGNEEEVEGVTWDGKEGEEEGKEKEEDAEEELDAEDVDEEEGGIRRETARERRQSRRQRSKDTLKQLCAYIGLHVMSNMQKTTEAKAREQVSTMYQCGV